MKRNAIKGSLALILALVIAFSVGCSNNQPSGNATPTPDATPTVAPTEEPVEILPDVPADRYDATVTPRTGNNATSPLVVTPSPHVKNNHQYLQ